MKMKLKHLLVTAATGVCTATVAHAAPFVNVQVLGSLTSGSGYVSSVNVTTGQTVFYEVVGQIATGTPNNANKNYTLAQPQTASDGINSIGFDLNNADATATLNSDTLTNGFNAGNGSSNGVTSGQSVSAIFAALSPGSVAGASAPIQILTGSLKAGSAKSDLFTGIFDGSAGIDVNATKVSSGITTDATPFSPSSTTETGANPYISFTPLTITQTPEPASLALVFIAVPAMLARRRQ